ncbi:hypothetical protein CAUPRSCDRAFT_11511 [Caulochytrium protostelioides]|uniref:RIIa domain-containing protein n=1 Tax=Caulochytrium protostelioides TaxID=1555241 RepID=A0A4P9WW94_9FUNG|nr:hypothetical protein CAUPRSCDRAFT_11511 [Caulochytrium protostelioides]
MQRQASPAPPSPSAPPGFTIPSAFPDVLKDLNREVLRSQPADLLQFCANYFQRRLEQERLAHRQALGHSGDAHAAATATTVASAPHAPSARPDATTSSTAAAFAPAPAAAPPPANPFAAPQEARLGPDDRAEPIMDPFAGPSPFAAPAAAGSSTGGPQPASPSHPDDVGVQSPGEHGAIAIRPGVGCAGRQQP